MKDKTIRVLLVDDEVELVDSLRKRLLRRGFTVVGVLSGLEAISMAKQRPFDVAVIDLKMPGMDGLEVLEKMKAIQPMVQAIMLTGHGSIEAAHHSGRLDASEFLLKPADFNQLVELIEGACDKKRKMQRQVFADELQKVVSSYRSPQEIMSATAQLREKYEQ